MVPFAMLGVAAGVLTTVAGLGGGILMMLVIAFVTDPKVALAATAPALLIGNLHRVSLFAREVDRPMAKSFALGAFPGSLIGGLLLPRLPTGVVAFAMCAMTLLALLRVLKVIELRPNVRAIVPAAFGIGALAATSGGAGLLAAPLLMSAGLTGAPYVSTAAAAAVAMHLGRVIAYGTTGLLDGRTLRLSAVLVVTVMVGNLFGKALRRHLSPATSTRLEVSALMVAATLGVAGVLH